MKKKKKSISERRIIKNEFEKRVYLIKGLTFGFIAFILLAIKFLETYLKVNSGIFNNLLLLIGHYTDILFGSVKIYVIIGLLILSVNNFFEHRIHTLKSIAYFIFLAGLSSYFIITKINISDSKNIVEAGQRLLEYGFDNGGILGAICSIPLYKFSAEYWYKLGLLIVSIVFLILSLYNFIKNVFMTIKQTQKYYNSPEYKRKKQVIEVKKKLLEEEKKMAAKAKEAKFRNIIIDKANESLDREIAKKPKETYFEKTSYYSKEELDEQQKKWNEYIKEQNRLKKIEDEAKRVEELEKEAEEFKNSVFEKEEEKIIEEVKEIKIENVRPYIPEPIEEEEDKEFYEEEKPLEPKVYDIDLQKSIEEVFSYKSINESEKTLIKQEIEENIETLEKVLKEYGVDAKVVDYVTGPTITRYEITIPTGTRVNKVTQLSDEIAMNLKADSVRFEAPIPGKGTIGIETPNKTKETVYFSNLIHSSALDKGELTVILGKDIIGKEKVLDIAKTPHLLIAGQTGSGKSVAINTIISTLISKKRADEVKFILIDPKFVELSPYNDIPHLLVPVIDNPEKAAISLKWAVSEMEERYKKMREVGVRNIKSYNQELSNFKMPYIVIIIDELADLMMVSANTVETSIARIAQKARAVGIHLIVATQRPSTDVITGMIKANLPSRMSFALRSQIDSRTILDQVGAEKLLGMGDMLLLENGSFRLERIQGAFISDAEVLTLTALLKDKFKPNYDMSILESNEDEDKDVDYDRALSIVEKYEDEKISISYLQREMKIGFNKASRICEQLKRNGILDENNRKIDF